ncbi:hypothetical protein M0P98_07780 [bacterium]|nr:hypothetical protein [bacterium]
MDEKTINEGKGLAWLSYLGLLLLVPLMVNKDNGYSKFHIKQGIVLMVCNMFSSFLFFIFSWIPFVGWFIIASIWLFLLILSIMGIVGALTGKTEPLPVIGQFAEKIKL